MGSLAQQRGRARGDALPSHEKGRIGVQPGTIGTVQDLQHVAHCLERGQHPCLGLAQRRKAQRRQPALKRPDVVTAESEIMREIIRTRREILALDPAGPATGDLLCLPGDCLAQAVHFAKQIGYVDVTSHESPPSTAD